MSYPEIRELSHRDVNQAALANLQAVFGALWCRGGKEPTGWTLMANPDANRVVRHYHTMDSASGRWADMEQPGVGGPDVISLAAWYIGVNRDRAAAFIAAALARAAPMPELPHPADPYPRSGAVGRGIRRAG